MYHSTANTTVLAEDRIPLYQKLPWIELKNDMVDAESYRDAYDAEIRYCDTYIGQLFQKIDELGLDNLVVIIVADHGESLGEHDYYFVPADITQDLIGFSILVSETVDLVDDDDLILMIGADKVQRLLQIL